MNVKKLMAALLAVAMLASVAGCSGKDKSWVASLGETKISAGVYSLNIMTALSEASYKSGVTVEPDMTEIFAADIDGKTGSQYIVDYAQNEARRQLATDAKFTALGMSLSAEETKIYTDYAKQMYASDLDMFKAIGVSEQSVIDYNRYSYQAYTLFDKLYRRGGEMAAPDAEVIKYFADTYNIAYVMPYVKIDPTTGAALGDADVAAVRAKAEKAKADVDGGKSIVDIIYDESSAQMAEGSEKPERGNDSNYMMMIEKTDNGSYPAALVSHLNTATAGSATVLVEDEQFIMLVQKLDETKVDIDIASELYNQMLPQLKNEEYLALCMTWADELEITFNDAAIKHYTGEKVKKDTDVYLKKVMASQPSSQPTVSAPQLSTPDVSASSDSAAPSSSSLAATTGEKNSLGKAQDYLRISPFSYTGLIEQLKFDGFVDNEAIYGADNCGADWNEQAAKKAKSYMAISSFSRQGLIDQLEFDGFTSEQATYGVTQNGY